MHPDQILISPLQLPVLMDDYLEKLRAKRVTALAMEYLRSEDGDYPIVRIMSEIAGSCAVLTAAEYLDNTREGGRGLHLGGISGVPPAKIEILGAGVVAQSAIVELILAFEEEFEGEISDEEAQKITTVGEAVYYINSRMRS